MSSINSDALEYENDLTADGDRRLRVKTFLSLARSHVQLDDSSFERAKELLALGFRGIDALHIAMAEKGDAEFFVTCDDGIAKAAKRFQNELKVRVVGLLEFLAEVMENVEND